LGTAATYWPIVPAPDDDRLHFFHHKSHMTKPGFELENALRNRIILNYVLKKVRVPVGSRIFTSPFRPDRLSGPPNLLYNGYQELFPGGKVAGREADHSPPTSAEVKKMWIYTSTPPYAFMA
jgi:hypothetical protein